MIQRKRQELKNRMIQNRSKYNQRQYAGCGGDAFEGGCLLTALLGRQTAR
jgi:hypothetical protein